MTEILHEFLVGRTIESISSQGSHVVFRCTDGTEVRVHVDIISLETVNMNPYKALILQALEPGPITHEGLLENMAQPVVDETLFHEALTYLNQQREIRYRVDGRWELA